MACVDQNGGGYNCAQKITDGTFQWQKKGSCMNIPTKSFFLGKKKSLEQGSLSNSISSPFETIFNDFLHEQNLLTSYNGIFLIIG